MGYVMNDDADNCTSQPFAFAVSPGGLITPDTWHHIGLRWDGSMVAVFVDGTLQAETPYEPVNGLGLSYSGTADFGEFFLGRATRWFGSSDHELIGQLDDARFYGRARSDKEIFTDYVSRGRKPAKPPGRK